jgi:hypothetical protein
VTLKDDCLILAVAANCCLHIVDATRREPFTEEAVSFILEQGVLVPGVLCKFFAGALLLMMDSGAVVARRC